MVLPRFKLSHFFKLIKPEYVLGTTYSVSFAFFESVVFPCIDKSQLKKCVILCDKKGFRRAASEASALRSVTRDYTAAHVPCSGSFHPKVWLLANRDKLALLVGSGNLTQSGFIENYELFEIVVIERGGPGIELAEDIVSFVEGLVNCWPANSQLLAVETLRELKALVDSFDGDLLTGENLPRLMTSFAGNFPTQLALKVEKPDSLYVASPYFGGSVGGIKSLLQEIKPRLTHVFPAIHKDSTVDIPFDSICKIEGVSVGTCKPLSNKNRFSHLKLYGLHLANDYWLFNSSVNCTNAALNGPNVEAGLLRQVPEQQFREYFPKDYQEGLKTTNQLKIDYSESNWIPLWATDVGDQVILVATQSSKLPLKDVKVEIRSGGMRSKFEVDVIFREKPEYKFSWSQFGPEYSRIHAARILIVSGVDSNGGQISGMAFVDDLAALTSEPRHRGAWRAAVSLLSLEGIPQYADIASLFSLIENVAFDELDAKKISTHSLPSGSTKEVIQDKAAVWPPVPIEANMDQLLTGGAGAGDLHWFDRILASLVSKRKEKVDPTVVMADDSEDEIELAEPDPKVVRGCNRIWSHVSGEFAKAQARLFELEIEDSDDHQAERIWGPITFLFLGTLAVRKAVVLGTREASAIDRPSRITKSFVSMMFGNRPQGSNYNPTALHVYEDDIFPPLGDDLAERFTLYPHFEIASILLVAFAHLHAASMKQIESFNILHWLLFGDEAGDNLQLSIKDMEHLENVWTRYFSNEEEAIQWSRVKDSIDELLQITWCDFDGMKKLRGNQRLLNSNEIQVTNLSSGICTKSGCPSRDKKQPASEREFQKLHPVTCKSCKQLVIPERLFNAYQKHFGGQHG